MSMLAQWGQINLWNYTFTDLFEKIVPLPVFEALTAFENRKSQLANMEIGRLREATALINR